MSPHSTTGAPATAGAFPCSGRLDSTRSTSIDSHSILDRLALIDPIPTDRMGSPRPIDSTRQAGHPITRGSTNTTTTDRGTTTRPKPKHHTDQANTGQTSTTHEATHGTQPTDQGTSHSTTSTTQEARQNDQHDHPGSTPKHSTTTTYSTTERPQNTRTQQGIQTRSSSQKYLQTLVCLPNRSVWRLAAPLTGEVAR